METQAAGRRDLHRAPIARTPPFTFVRVGPLRPLTCSSAAAGELVADDQTYTVGRTHRVRHVSMPARLVNRAGRLTLRAPTRWPWAAESAKALDALRILEPATGRSQNPTDLAASQMLTQPPKINPRRTDP
jgi:hypothetical protein